MANRKHLQVLKQGVQVWNQWREQNGGITPDLYAASLGGADLMRANLSYANLYKADLMRANLTGTNLYKADLSETNLSYANLTGADLMEANLTGANLCDVALTDADLFQANLLETVFSNTDLAEVRGLETCYHLGPSTLDHRTLAKSGPLPLAFLRGCGLPDALIDYLPSLLNEPFQFYSCFISYSSRDDALAKRLHADLQNHGVRCWF